jgi:hypothetical protein
MEQITVDKYDKALELPEKVSSHRACCAVTGNSQWAGSKTIRQLGMWQYVVQPPQIVDHPQSTLPQPPAAQGMQT